MRNLASYLIQVFWQLFIVSYCQDYFWVLVYTNIMIIVGFVYFKYCPIDLIVRNIQLWKKIYKENSTYAMLYYGFMFLLPFIANIYEKF